MKHTEETKKIISEVSKRTMKQANAGFRQIVSCSLCSQKMSPANLGKHFDVCKKTRGFILNGVQMSVKDIKKLRITLRQYGYSVEEYLKMNEKQKGLCAICKKPPTKNRLSADHCHVSMKPRLLLCELCNTGLGSFKDDIDLMKKAISYLKKFSH